ncbi:hypothetical protein PMZ80_004172 [Knufia obscura]|uniref:Uncharacterized protein n=2 Tax=Knufia TaxID=430999 RepID=A0AAN8EEE5_9EURO|nr:hypothetical protein PMZ80_004172 [Knufia obscura]KAK5948702.1 hypothetical protein OHC33_010305 [Knufia fluminis]
MSYHRTNEQDHGSADGSQGETPSEPLDGRPERQPEAPPQFIMRAPRQRAHRRRNRRTPIRDEVAIRLAAELNLPRNRIGGGHTYHAQDDGGAGTPHINSIASNAAPNPSNHGDESRSDAKEEKEDQQKPKNNKKSAKTKTRTRTRDPRYNLPKCPLN